jgi:hypothetical protein
MVWAEQSPDCYSSWRKLSPCWWAVWPDSAKLQLRESIQIDSSLPLNPRFKFLGLLRALCLESRSSHSSPASSLPLEVHQETYKAWKHRRKERRGKIDNNQLEQLLHNSVLQVQQEYNRHFCRLGRALTQGDGKFSCFEGSL